MSKPDTTVSPHAFRVVAAIAVWALLLTILSGAAVRLTGSGLGCPDWPNCTRTGVVAPLQAHAWIEFGNRLINALVTIASLGALAAALRRRPRRPDLTLLSAGLVVGLVSEVVMGGLLVIYHLNPVLVSAHFLLGLLFLGVAVVLQDRAQLPDGSTRTPLVARPQILLGRLLMAALAVVVVLGTVVTSTGPHGGDPKAPRFQLSLHQVAQAHGTAVEVLLFITLFTLWHLARVGAPPPVVRRAQIMLATMAAQAAVGYIQYFNGDPVAIVAVHVAGASLLVLTALRYYLGLWAPLPTRIPARVAAAVPG